MAKVATLGDVREALVRVRSAEHLEPTQPRMNVRMIFAIVSLGYLRRANEVGGWGGGSRAMSWREPSGGRRNLLIGAINEIFGFPTGALLRHSGAIRRKDVPVARLPDLIALDPLSNMPPRPGQPKPCKLVFRDRKWWSIGVPISSSRWWWNADDGVVPVNRTEFNPGNTINTQQGVECFAPLEGESRNSAINLLSADRPDCPEFSGARGDGYCNAAPTGEKCMAAGKNVVWPRVVMTDPDEPAQWGIAPDGFEALREHVGTASFGALREDLALLAGTCKALRGRDDFESGTIVVDELWLRSQLSTDAWEALRP